VIANPDVMTTATLGSGFASLAQFARTLRRDLKAVQLAIPTRWSNGPVEGPHSPALGDQETDVRPSQLPTTECSCPALELFTTRILLHRKMWKNRNKSWSAVFVYFKSAGCRYREGC
jgi:hypothetical protein